MLDVSARQTDVNVLIGVSATTSTGRHFINFSSCGPFIRLRVVFVGFNELPIFSPAQSSTSLRRLECCFVHDFFLNESRPESRFAAHILTHFRLAYWPDVSIAAGGDQIR